MFNSKALFERRLSLVLLVLVHLSCLFVFAVPFRWGLVGLALGGYLLRMWAITAGYHRYFSHRTFKTSRAFQFLLAWLGTSSMQNGPLWWASWHRRHHKYSDTPLDPHSAVQRGFWYAHLGWALDEPSSEPDFSNIGDLTRYRELVLLDKHKWFPIIVYALICFAVAGLPGAVWGFSVSTVLLFHGTLLINSLGHVWGSRRYATGDHSRNNLLLAIVTLGEGWHNNHHHFMSSARQGFFWWELDLSFYSLKVLSWLGIVWDVREPTEKALAGPLVAVAPPVHALIAAAVPAPTLIAPPTPVR
jgi:stearoyl-CoA desaturase (Delta-9 desaturase)